MADADETMPSMSEPPTQLRPPRQKRSLASYERVLDAARLLLEENGFEGFTVQEVAARAEISVGGIYERFGNKESLLRVVHGQLMDALARGAAGLERAGEISDPAAAIAAAVATVARVPREHRQILRVFMHLGAVDAEIAARGSQASVELGRAFKAALLAHRGSIAHPNPELAVDIAFRMAYCTVARQIMYGPVFESERRVGWSTLVEQLSAASCAYLLSSPPDIGIRGARRSAHDPSAVTAP
jgi:AcrR family transcriptional regulator